MASDAIAKDEQVLLTRKRILIVSCPVLVFFFIINVTWLNPEFLMNPGWFYWHPVSMLASIILCAVPSILIRQLKGKLATKIHECFMLLSTALMLFGYFVIYMSKESKGKPHLVSLHAKVGFVGIFFVTLITFISTILLDPDHGILKEVKTPFVRKLKMSHKFFGRFLLGMLLYATWLGIEKTYHLKFPVTLLFQVCLIGCFVILIRTVLIK